MSDHLDQIDPQRKRYDYLREHLEDAHERAGDAVEHLVSARTLSHPDMPDTVRRVHELVGRAQKLDREIGRLLDSLFPQEEPEEGDDDPLD